MPLEAGGPFGPSRINQGTESHAAGGLQYGKTGFKTRRNNHRQRACFKISMVPGLEMDLPVEEIKGFSVGKIALFTAVTIHSRSGET